MSLGTPPAWTSLRYLREELVRTTELVDGIYEHIEIVDGGLGRDEKALDWAEAEHARAHKWLEHRERELWP